MRRAFLVAAIFGCANPRPDEPAPVLPSADQIGAELGGLEFDAFVDRSFRHLLRRSPEFVIDLGLDDEIDVGQTRIDDVSDAFFAETQAIERVILDRLRSYDRAALGREARIARDAYEWYLDDQLRFVPVEDLDYRLSAGIVSLHATTEFFFTDTHPLETEADADAYVARLWRIEEKYRAIDQTLARLADKGIVLPRLLLELTHDQLDTVASSRPEDTAFYRTLDEKITGTTKDGHLAAAKEAIETSVIPAYAALAKRLFDLHDRAPDGIGVGALPGGDAYYAVALRHHVTADTTADELEALGRSELTRIQAELRVKFDDFGYPKDASLDSLMSRVAREGGLVPKGEVLATYTSNIREAEGRLGEAFDVAPKASVRVEPDEVGGYYAGPSLDGSRPGVFYAGVDEGGEARFTMKTLAYHEAVPGHHLQIGVAQDLELPLFQRVITFTGYTEGWGLYAEALAGELGWYAGDPYGDAGRLQFEAYRAARLVVDTGIHARGWTMPEAQAFLVANTGLSPGRAQFDVIRYASWPGQATAYYTGFARLRALRARAEAKLGADFDLVKFHRAVLLHGALPIGVLEAVVTEELGL